jgi:hypothetical protein
MVVSQGDNGGFGSRHTVVVPAVGLEQLAGAEQARC